VIASAGGFKLQQRALHVYAEAARVPAFKGVCDSAAPAEEKIAQLGALMDDSQASCRHVARAC
jgi:galactokinase